MQPIQACRMQVGLQMCFVDTWSGTNFDDSLVHQSPPVIPWVFFLGPKNNAWSVSVISASNLHRYSQSFGEEWGFVCFSDASPRIQAHC